MMKLLPKHVAVFSCSLLLLCAAAAEAQAEPGEGIQAENFRLNLGLDVNGRATSNLFFQEENTTPLAWSLGVTPNLSVETLDPKVFALELDWGGTWRQYLSSNNAISSQSGFSTVLGAAAHINPAGAFSLRLEEAFTRTNEAPNSITAATINRIVNRAGAVIGVHPGGRVFEGHLSYHWHTFLYNLENSTLNQLNKDEHRFGLRTSWRFLPRTALVLMGDWRMVRYKQAARQVAADSSLVNINSNPLRIQAGLNGLILNNLSLQLLGGYGMGFYETGPNFQGIIGSARATYFLRNEQDSSISLGYRREFEDATLGSLFRQHTALLAYGQNLFDKKLRLGLEGSTNFRTYLLPESGTFPVQNGGEVQLPTQIDDTLVNLIARMQYNPTKWLGVRGQYDLQMNITDSNVQLVTNAPTEIPGRSYTRHLVTLSAVLTY